MPDLYNGNRRSWQSGGDLDKANNRHPEATATPTKSQDRRRLELLSWDPVTGSGALLGRAKVRLPIGLEIDGVAVFEKDGRRWATLPAEVIRDRDGQTIKDERGKARYRSMMRWSSRDLQDRFAAALLALIGDDDREEPR